jgi:UrcA family protein
MTALGGFILNTSTRIPRAGLLLAFAVGAITFLGSAQAAEAPQEITITGTRVERIPYDFSVRRPVKEVSVSATVPADLNVLTLNSGVALLKYNVRQAALKACIMADPGATATDDTTVDCVNEAVDNARPQVNALIERAHREANG